MPRERFRNMRRPKAQWLLGAVALYACSFQNFDYLNEGSGGKVNSSGGGASKGGSTGNGGTGTTAGSGGDIVVSRGGSAGAEAMGGEGGDAGAGGAPVQGNGGFPGMGGAITSKGGATSGGATSAGGSSQGGTTARGGSSSGGATNPTLVNPSFESSLTGWTIDPPDAGPSGKRYVYTQAPTDSSKPPNGSQELATWHDKDSYQVSIFQTVHGLKDGVYTFQGYFSSDRSGGTYIFARNCGGTDREAQVPTTSWTWFTFALKDIQVSGGNCEVGIRVVGAPNDYLNADMFTFDMNPDGAGGAGGAGGA